MQSRCSFSIGFVFLGMHPCFKLFASYNTYMKTRISYMPQHGMSYSAQLTAITDRYPPCVITTLPVSPLTNTYTCSKSLFQKFFVNRNKCASLDALLKNADVIVDTCAQEPNNDDQHNHSHSPHVSVHVLIRAETRLII